MMSKFKTYLKAVAFSTAMVGAGMAYLYHDAVPHMTKAEAKAAFEKPLPPEPKPKKAVNKCHEALDKMFPRCTVMHNLLWAIMERETAASKRLNAPYAVMINKGELALTSQYFNSAEQALVAIDGLRAWGLYTDSLDLGCAQTNWSFWGEHYETMHDAFVPKENLRVARIVLKECVNKTKSHDPMKLAGCYHSMTPEKQRIYLGKLRQHYNQRNAECLKGAL